MALVLVVDDDSEVLAVLREALEEGGHSVVTAPDGREGLRLYHAHHPDLVITDIFMRGRSGIDLVLQLGRETPRPQMIAISGVTGPEFLAAGVEAHVGRTFTKPFDVYEVVRAVDALVARPPG